VLNLSFIPLIYFCYPETKGVTLEQMDHIFIGKGTGLSALTQGVKESIYVKRHYPQEIENIDEESGIEEKGRKDAQQMHVEVATA
jgi:hypothetical protein